MKQKKKERSAGDGSGGADREKIVGCGHSRTGVGGLQRSGGLNTVPGFIEELPWWVGVGRGLTPHAPCAQRLLPGRGCGWARG